MKLLIALLFIALSSGLVYMKTDVTAVKEGIAVVELFTSEGCSSCPPADAAVIKLAAAKKMCSFSPIM